MLPYGSMRREEKDMAQCMAVRALVFIVGSLVVPIGVAYGVTSWTLQEERLQTWQGRAYEYRLQAGQECLDFQAWVIEAKQRGSSTPDVHVQVARAFEAAAVDDSIGEDVGDYFQPCGAADLHEIEDLVEALFQEAAQ